MTRVQPLHFPVTRKSEPAAWIAASQAGAVHSAFGPPEDGAAAERDRLEAQLAERLTLAEAEGRARGEAEGRARVEQRVVRLDAILAELLDVRRRTFASMQRELVDLAMCVASAILRREIAGDREQIVRVVEEAVGMVADRDEVEISVAPADLPLLRERQEEISRGNPRAGTLLIRASDSIDVGCVVETRLARIDATLETRLRNVAESLYALESR